MKYIKLFEDHNNPDLRRIGEYVYCKKTLHDEINRTINDINGITHINTLVNFIEGKYYRISTMYGDPKKAIEKYGINNYLPVDCISVIMIKDDNNVELEFKVNPYYISNKRHKDFFKYFEIPEFTDAIDQYNL